MTPTKTLLAASALCLTAGGALADEFNAAETCAIERMQEEVLRYHRTTDAHEIDVNAHEEFCETKTGMQIEDPRILKNDSVGFYAGGTHFTYKYTPPQP